MTLALYCAVGINACIHADIHWKSFMPIHLWEAIGSWGASSGVWFCWLCFYPVQGKAILDLKELLGRKLGREWILEDL